jgi:prepilin-type N-terminal cleavage/methylation domain-containing protein
MAPKKNKAFTLIEILTVTAIMGILIVVITPAVLSTVKRGRAADCSVNLRAIQGAKASFLINNMGKLFVDTNKPLELAEFEACFIDGGIPSKCPSNQDMPGGQYQDVYDLYKDSSCANNCPQGRSINDYPLEIRAGPENQWYRNGYHDLYDKN